MRNESNGSGRRRDSQSSSGRSKGNNCCLIFDIYGSQVTLTFQGNHKFRTQFGAAVSIFLGLVLLTYALFKSTELISPDVFMALPIASSIKMSSFMETYSSIGARVTDRHGSKVNVGSFEGPV